MKHKLLTFALMGAFASTMLFSCKNAEEPIPSPGDNNSGEIVEYSISVNIPEEMRTRAAAEATIGESGLFEFPLRTIDKLWYAMYYDGTYKSSNSILREDDQSFSFTVRLDDKTDPSKLSFFFWAGSSGDQDGSDRLSFDFNNCVVTINPVRFSSVSNAYYDNHSVSVYDSFAGYFQFANSDDKSIRSATFTLKRPFAEFHLLCDDFIPTSSDLYKDYPGGIRTFSGLGSEKVNYSNYKNQMMLPNRWHYATNEVSNSLYDVNDLEFTNVGESNYLFNYLKDDTNDLRVTFKGRKMDYLAYFYAFAPLEENQMVNKANDNAVIDKLNFVISKNNGSTISYSSSFISVPLPENGIKANNKYVIYNKSREDGGNGFLEGFFDYEILVNHDGIWESPNHENEVDKL